MKRKIVIVGHGLAGAILAHSLIKNHQSVVVLDANLPDAATPVSAGLINPFIGPKLNVPNDFALCMKENLSFFKNTCIDGGKEFLEKIDLYRIFQSSEQRSKWELLTDIYKDSTISFAECKKLGIHSKLGAGKTHAWKLNTNEFINYSRAKLLALGSYIPEKFDSEKWKGNRVIFCDGYRAAKTKWFNYLPFAPAQGDVIKIKSDYNINASNGTWHLAEKGERIARIGSTWKHKNIESGPTPSARQEILKKINFLQSLDEEEILNHTSGIRSGTVDRQPMLGQHPQFKNYFLFNGFGSRGCTTIALNAKQFISYLCDGVELPSQKDIKRFTA